MFTDMGRLDKSVYYFSQGLMETAFSTVADFLDEFLLWVSEAADGPRSDRSVSQVHWPCVCQQSLYLAVAVSPDAISCSLAVLKGLF